MAGNQTALPEVLAAIPTKRGELSTNLHGHHLTLYPFVEGDVAMEVGLTPQQWADKRRYPIKGR